MIVEVVYTNRAIKDLNKLENSISEKIFNKIEYFSQQKSPLNYARKLKPPFDDMYRFKIGDYRVIFEIDKNGKVTVLTILAIKHRKNVYR